jgi:hypothetical protein
LSSSSSSSSSSSCASSSSLSSSSSSSSAVEWHYPIYVTPITGSIYSGTLDNLYVKDETKQCYTEPTGTPSFIYDFTFENVPSGLTSLTFHAAYSYSTGLINHIIKLAVWNYNTTTWDYVTTNTRDFPRTTPTVEVEYSIGPYSGLLRNDPAPYISGGIVKYRIIHLSQGNPSHIFCFDWMYIDDEVISSSSSSSSSSYSSSSRSSSSYSSSSRSSSSYSFSSSSSSISYRSSSSSSASCVPTVIEDIRIRSSSSSSSSSSSYAFYSSSSSSSSSVSSIMSVSSSSSSSSWSIVPAAGLKAIRDRKAECIVKVTSVCIEDPEKEEIERRRLKVVIKNVLIQ